MRKKSKRKNFSQDLDEFIQQEREYYTTKEVSDRKGILKIANRFCRELYKNRNITHQEKRAEEARDEEEEVPEILESAVEQV